MWISIAFMYLGAVIGAGFASGREAWQYFGVFGDLGYFGTLIEMALFVIFGVFMVVIAQKEKTADIGEIILPFNNKRWSRLLGTTVGLINYSALVALSAAGGAMFEQRFGIHPAAGGALIVFLVLLTVLGDFDRIFHVFRVIMPFLFAFIVGTALYAGFTLEKVPAPEGAVKPSVLSGVWYLSAVIYASYNLLVTIPINAKSALRAKSLKQAVAGVSVGGVCLALMGMILLRMLLLDPVFSESMSLPILGYAGRISPLMENLISIALLTAIYSSATSCYYGFTTRFKEGPNKKKLVIFFAVLGFFLGLVGFKSLITYMYPLEGYFGMAVLILITIHFFRVIKRR